MKPLIKRGKPAGFSGIIEDITARKQAEDSLRESEEKFRTIFENANDAIIYVDEHGIIIDVNDRLEKITGYKREEAIGKNFAEFPFLDPGDMRNIVDLFTQSLETGGHRLFEFQVKRKDGHTIFAEASTTTIKDESAIKGALTILRDITERKRAEEQIIRQNRELAALNDIAQTVSQSLHLDETLNNALDKMLQVLSIKHGGIYLIDPKEQHLILEVHRGIRDEYGIETSVIDMRDGNVGRVLETKESLFIESLPDSLELVAPDARNVIIHQHLKSVVLMPLQARRKTLGVMFAATAHKRIFTQEERELLITIGHQISTAIENAMLYEELERKEKLRGEALRQAILAQEEERKRIARELHDQTSQVLTGASAMIEVSIAGLPWGTDEVKSRLKETRLSLTNMLVDVRNIIYELRPTMLDDLGLVAAARWHAEEYLDRVGIIAHIETAGRKRKLPTNMETALFRILQEATTNIVKHAKAKNARIKLEFHKDSFVLDIEDDGRGFDTRKVASPGHKKRGMGLLNMRERVEMLNGDLTIESQPRGHGTRITVSIPM